MFGLSIVAALRFVPFPSTAFAALLSQGKQIQVCTSQRTVSAHALEQMKKDVPVLLVAALLVVLQRSNEMSVAVALCLSR
mmetsp:Transcript_15186/g.30915  ORF Transcript_15186/g.30915 Transcript_15186/m.30915 type:complete len:80 (+) Transcript_15186:79-318(+)